MAQRKKKLNNVKFTAQEALNIIISDDYTFDTSSSHDSSSSSSCYSDDSSDTNLPSSSKEVITGNHFLPKTLQNDMLDEHGKIAGVSLTHVQPTFKLPTALEAEKKLDTGTSQTIDHNHDNCQFGDTPDTVHTPSSPTIPQPEFILSIPIQFELQNEP